MVDLKQLQIDIKSSLRASDVVNILEQKIKAMPDTNEAQTEIIIFILGKVTPKILQSKIASDWANYKQVVALLCQKVNSFDLLIAL